MRKQTNDHDKPSTQRSEFVNGQFDAVENFCLNQRTLLILAVSYRVGLFDKALPEKSNRSLLKGCFIGP